MNKILKIFLFFAIIFNCSAVFAQENNDNIVVSHSYEKAMVLSVEDIIEEIDKKNNHGGKEIVSFQKLKIKILSGKYKNDEQEIKNSISNNPLDLNIKKGDKILIYIEELQNGAYTTQVQGFYVLPSMIFLILLFFLVLLIIGGKQGLKAILSLAVSIFLIFKLFIPRALNGDNPILLSLIVSAIIAIVTLTLISGFRKKTISAILGTIGGVASAALLAIIFGNFAHLNGLSDENAITMFSQFSSLDFKGLLFAGIIIGALGAVMDVAMSISSTIAEVKKANPQIKKTRLIKAGLAVGKDIMGTMSNTLIFAYVGSSLFLVLLFTQYGESYLNFLNFNFVAEEIVRSIAGSIGLILAVPLTAIIAGYLESKNK
ncbi:MAG: YibE/F family protein [Patescibacteria group bacterium]|nr:YibE/F family protein [Patescibacteria group bacterium]